MTEPKPDPQPWLGVYFSAADYGRQQGYNDGYRDGHRDGHFDGWNAALARAKANDVEFLRGLVDEFRRRELEDEHMDTSDRQEWIRKLIESLEAKKRRDEYDARNRRERAYQQQRNNEAA